MNKLVEQEVRGGRINECFMIFTRHEASLGRCSEERDWLGMLSFGGKEMC